MPEIKRNFTGGRMNKDLDERFIKSGDYKDATNVQVSTSDEDSVGTVENILGNNPGCTYINGNVNPIGQGSKTVGSVSDEKNDSLYWLVSGSKEPSGIPLPPDDPNAIPLTYTSRLFKDFIMRTNALSVRGCEPVFVDVYRILTYNSSYDDASVGSNPSTWQNNINLYDPSIEPNISVGMEVSGWSSGGWWSGGTMLWSTTVASTGNLQTIPLYYESGIDHFSTITPPVVIAVSNPNSFGLGYGFGWGCTDINANNYDSSVFADDGSCNNTGGSTGGSGN